MRTAAVRVAPALGSIVSRTVPLPLPLAPALTWTQDASDAVVHGQPVSVDTVSVMLPPEAATDVLDGETVNVHGAACCDTATCEPLTLMAALRGVGWPFASTRYETVAAP
jgi:hypothetical protein